MLKNSVRLLLAAVLVFLTAGCIKDPEFQPADMGVSVEELSFSKDGGEATVRLLSNRDWDAEITVTRGTADWIVLSDTAGTASGDSVTVTVTVLPNTGEDRDAVLRFTTGTVSAMRASRPLPRPPFFGLPAIYSASRSRNSSANSL